MAEQTPTPEELVKRIAEEAREPMATSEEGTQYRMGVIRGNAERLKVLLEARDAGLDKLVGLTQIAVWRAEGDGRDVGVFLDNKAQYAEQLQNVLGETWLLQAKTALARVKGGS